MDMASTAEYRTDMSSSEIPACFLRSMQSSTQGRKIQPCPSLESPNVIKGLSASGMFFCNALYKYLLLSLLLLFHLTCIAACKRKITFSFVPVIPRADMLSNAETELFGMICCLLHWIKLHWQHSDFGWHRSPSSRDQFLALLNEFLCCGTLTCFHCRLFTLTVWTLGLNRLKLHMTA